MTNDNTQGLDQSPSVASTPTPDKSGRMAEYYAMNEPVASTEGSVATPVPPEPEPSQAVETPPKESAPKGDAVQSEGKGYDRRVRVLTARETEYKKKISAMEERLARLEGPAKKQEISRDGYQTQAEYDRVVAKEAAKEALSEEISTMKQQEDAQRGVQEFRQTLAQKAKATMAPAEIEHYRGMIAEGADPEQLFTPAVREFLDDSEMGMRMMYTLMSHPELIDRVNALKGTTLAARMLQLEDLTARDLQGMRKMSEGATASAAVQTPQVSKAPAPIGDFGAQGGSAANLSDEERLALYYKRNPR